MAVEGYTKEIQIFHEKITFFSLCSVKKFYSWLNHPQKQSVVTYTLDMNN